MTSTSLSRRIPGASDRARAVLLVGAACVVGLAAGRLSISHYGTTAVQALIAIPILIYMVPRPMVSLLVLLVLTSSVFAYDVLPRLALPGHLPLNIGDFVLLATVGGTLWRRPWRTWPPPVQRFSLVLGLMLLLALIPTIKLAMSGHNAARDAIGGYKTLLYLTGALTISLELSGRQWRTLLTVLIVASGVVAVLSLGAAASGGFATLLARLDPNGALLGAVAPGAPAARVRLPGLFLVYAMTIPTLVLALTVKDRWRSARIVALCLMIGAIAISLNRNMYFGGLIALMITILVGGARLRHRFLATALAIVAVAAIVVQSAVLPAVTAKVGARAASALSTQVLASGSAQARADEFSHAFTAVVQHPWYGVGWFQNYGSYAGHAYRLGVEDWYLHVTTDLGIPVAVAFMLIPWMVLAYGFRRARSAARPRDRALAAAGVGSVIALLLSCLVGSYLQDPGTML
ncbi:MAG: O-antigen ligase family protein, partial [Actinomycetota bacterium]|nr:O-antigen ligase family protein [Actinomycetota bacterium]